MQRWEDLEEGAYGDDAGREPAPPSWFPGQHLPADASRMGLTAHVPDGALLDFAGTLDSGNARHRLVAWMLLVVFGLPVFFYVLRFIDLVTGAR